MLKKTYGIFQKSAIIQSVLLFFIFMMTLFFYPADSGYGRTIYVVMLPSLWLVMVFVLRKYKLVVGVFLAPIILFMIFICLPGSNVDQNKLRNTYVDSLKSYEGIRYIWGGENRMGIDCSGLVRNGLINANLKQSFLTGNPKLFRHGFQMWWYDCSAKALRDGYRELTQRQFMAISINHVEGSKLLPGDLAVTTSGSHILAYLGNNKWIEADPGLGETVIAKTPSSISWFNTRVYVLRWSQFVADE